MTTTTHNVAKTIRTMSALRKFATANPDATVFVKGYTTKFTATAAEAIHILDSLAKTDGDDASEIREARVAS